jgi:hypothetical protein
MDYDFDHKIFFIENHFYLKKIKIRETKFNNEKLSTKKVNQKSILLTLNYLFIFTV